MSAETLEVMIETAWLQLARLHRDDTRTVFLSRYSNGVVRISGTGRAVNSDARAHRCEVGTYTRAATLQQFREDVFFVFDQMQGRKAA